MPGGGVRFALLSVNKVGVGPLSRQPYGLATLGLDSGPTPTPRFQYEGEANA